MIRQVPFLALLLAAGLAGAARAEIVELANGGSVEGKAVRVGEVLRVELGSGSVIYLKASEVAAIRPGSWKDDYAARRAALGRQDAEGRYQLAIWCARKGLNAESEAEIRAALAIAPGHSLARARLDSLEEARRQTEARAKAAAQAAAQTPVPVPAPAELPPEENASDGLARHQGAHCLAVCDGSAELARRLARMGDEVVADFTRVFNLPPESAGLRAFRVRIRYHQGAESWQEACRKEAGAGDGFYNNISRTCHVRGHGTETISVSVQQTIRHEVTHALAFQVLGVAGHCRWFNEVLATVMEGLGEDGLGEVNRSARPWFLSGKVVEKLKVADLLASKFGGKLSLADYTRAWAFAHFIFYGEAGAKEQPRKRAFLALLADARTWGADLDKAFDRQFPDRQALEAAWREHVKGILPRIRPPAAREVTIDIQH
jgi:hypothetical protein